MRTSLPPDVGELARLYGVQTRYRDAWGKTQHASTDSVLAVLRELGAAVDTLADVGHALAHRRAEMARPATECVAVMWDGAAVTLPFASRRPADLTLVREDGEERSWRQEPGAGIEVGPLPFGYHRLGATLSDGSTSETLLVSAPMKPPQPDPRLWGVFIPLYSLRTHRSWATGDLTDLAELCRWAASAGAGTVATLPLYASFLDERPFEPSPYAPVTRLHWNELYCDPGRAPELEASGEARELLGSAGFRGVIDELRSAQLVDYRAGYAAKRRVLEARARAFFERAGDRRHSDLAALERSSPTVRDYARFRAKAEADPDAAERYHLYAQLLCVEQLSAAAVDGDGCGLFLDLPVGVHPDGFDVAHFGDSFGTGASVGAPPDIAHPGGQDWGFQPIDPVRSRERGHEYAIAAIRNSVRFARLLRIDHVMGFHRLYWIPRGASCAEGVYVRYPHDELYAILALEAHRSGTAVVGEDLGTVPDSVRTEMGRHGLLRLHVFLREAFRGPSETLGAVPANSLACTGSHDTAMFATMWETGEEDKREALTELLRSHGLVGPRPTTTEALRACLAYLAGGPAQVMLVQLEDLWGEREPQNVPGSDSFERPNWRRKAAMPLEEFGASPLVRDTLAAVDRARRLEERVP